MMLLHFVLNVIGLRCLRYSYYVGELFIMYTCIYSTVPQSDFPLSLQNKPCGLDNLGCRLSCRFEKHSSQNTVYRSPLVELQQEAYRDALEINAYSQNLLSMKLCHPWLVWAEGNSLLKYKQISSFGCPPFFSLRTGVDSLGTTKTCDTGSTRLEAHYSFEACGQTGFLLLPRDIMSDGKSQFWQKRQDIFMVHMEWKGTSYFKTSSEGAWCSKKNFLSV